MLCTAVLKMFRNKPSDRDMFIDLQKFVCTIKSLISYFILRDLILIIAFLWTQSQKIYDCRNLKQTKQ